MTIKELRTKLGDTQAEFAERYNIPYRTLQNWELGLRKPPEYVEAMFEEKVNRDLVNHKTRTLPKYDPNKIDLPKRKDYLSVFVWLQEVKKIFNEDVIFGCDDALMCLEYFLGRNQEDILWVYGSDNLKKFNNVVLLGNRMNKFNIIEKNGIKFTDFNRTLNDCLANEDILDMQGITEALSKYYYKHNEDFDGIYVEPGFEDSFLVLALDAIEYYEN